MCVRIHTHTYTLVNAKEVIKNYPLLRYFNVEISKGRG